jgi:hypothetical protein
MPYWEMTIWEVLLMLKVNFRQNGKETGKAQVTVTRTALPGRLQVPELHVAHVVVPGVPEVVAVSQVAVAVRSLAMGNPRL